MVVYKIVKRNMTSIFAGGKYCLKYEIGKWTEAPAGRLFCFMNVDDAIKYINGTPHHKGIYYILKCEAKDVVYEMKASIFSRECDLDYFYSGEAEEYDITFLSPHEHKAFPKRVRPIEIVKI